MKYYILTTKLIEKKSNKVVNVDSLEYREDQLENALKFVIELSNTKLDFHYIEYELKEDIK